MRDVFKTMPSEMIPYLTENNRLDFIDFIDSNMNAEVNNLLGGKSRMTKLTAEYADLKLNEASTVSLRLLPVSEPVDSARQIVCMVRTFGTDIQESSIGFYSVNWRPLNTSDYMPDINGIMAEQTSDNNSMVVATLHADVPELTLTTVPKINPPANNEQKEGEKTSMNLKWNDGFINER